MSKDNLELWNKVEKTNPNYTKKANLGGNKITSIAPQYQIMNATEQFGPYGETWGFKNIELDYSLVNTGFKMDKTEGVYPNKKVIGKEDSTIGLVIFKAIFFYPKGEFQTINSISLFTNNERSKIDDNFAKKLETDTLTKALSKLGFNADIFLGKFDDQRYLEDVTAEFHVPTPEEKEYIEKLQLAIEEMGLCTTLDELGECWTKHNNLQKSSELQRAKDERKKLLTDGSK